jgi:DNA repair photolyase
MVVFWTKNPKPIIPLLSRLDKQNIGYYFLFTLNDYEKEGFEPNLPPLEERIQTFQRLAEKIGKKRVIWRFDPLILTRELTEQKLIGRIQHIGDVLHPYTDKLIFSFIQVSPYRKVQQKLAEETRWFSIENPQSAEFSDLQKLNVARRIKALTEGWNIQAASCAEPLQLENTGIEPSKCVDDRLMAELYPNDEILMHFLRTGTFSQANQKTLFAGQAPGKQSLKDPGQRKECRCIPSKDIGQYNTCPHLCAYCYANASRKSTLNNHQKHHSGYESILKK